MGREALLPGHFCAFGAAGMDFIKLNVYRPIPHYRAGFLTENNSWPQNVFQIEDWRATMKETIESYKETARIFRRKVAWVRSNSRPGGLLERAYLPGASRAAGIKRRSI